MLKKMFHQFRRRLSKIWLEVNLQLTVVGVTGSYGKTTAVNAISKILSTKYSVNKTDDNLDTVYNLPITILKTKIWNEVLVLEYGVDHIGEMDKHLSLVKPKIAVLTGITSVHSDEEHFGSLENIIREKIKLIEALPKEGLAVFNWDDEEVRKIAQKYQGRKVTYGTDKKADVWADEISIKLAGTNFTLYDGKEKYEIMTQLLGYPAVYSCLIAYIVGKEKNISKEKMFQKMAELVPLNGRFSIEPGPLGTTLINDSKRANYASTIAGIKSLAEFPRRKVAVLGEMGEIGEKEAEMHRAVGKEVANYKIDLLVGVGPLAKYIVEEAKNNGLKNAFWAKDVKQAADILKDKLKKDDLFYLKASLLRHLERIVIILKGGRVDCKETICHHYSPCDTCVRLVQ